MRPFQVSAKSTKPKAGGGVSHVLVVELQEVVTAYGKQCAFPFGLLGLPGFASAFQVGRLQDLQPLPGLAPLLRRVRFHCTFSGKCGCNRLIGGIELEGDRLCFPARRFEGVRRHAASTVAAFCFKAGRQETAAFQGQAQ